MRYPQVIRFLFLAAASAALLGSEIAAAQAPPVIPEDSARALRSARSAQGRFEAIRRNHLPWTHSRGGGPCDERIGRFCLWYGDGTSTWEPPPEPEPVQAARTTLIAHLDAATALFPGDAWVAGQRVRYLIEAERNEDAVVAARECQVDPVWWCLALEGYALHTAAEFAAADSAFAAALEAMPPRERRRWTDLTPLLEHGERSYRRLSEVEREAFEERFWWLAKPLYLLPGNDHRTEHYSRHVIDRLQDRARSTEGISWGADLRELLLRYGSPAGWERIRPRSLSLQADGMVTRYPRGSRQFVPLPHFLEDPAAIGPEDWSLDKKRSRTGYAPSYTSSFATLEHQVAAFNRGDSVVVVAAVDLTHDTLFAEVAEAETGLFLLHDEHSAPRVARRMIENGTGSLSLNVAPGPTLMSLEVRAPTERRAGRARYGLRLTAIPPHGVGLSDVLLLGAVDSLPSSLAEAIPAARGSGRVRGGEKIGLYWEVYGVDPNEAFSVTILLTEENRGVLRRLGERLGIVREVHPVRVRWQEAPAQDAPILPRSLELEVPEVSPGRYRLELTLTLAGREPLSVSRQVQVVE